MAAEEQIKEVMGLVIDVSCAGIEYGAAAEETKRDKLRALYDAESAIEAKLRNLIKDEA